MQGTAGRDKKLLECLTSALVLFAIFAAFLLITPCDSHGHTDDLIKEMKELVGVIKDNTQLASVNYDKEKTSMAAAIEREDVQAFFSDQAQIRSNTEALNRGMVRVEKSVTNLGKKIENQDDSITALKISSTGQGVEISGVKEDVRDIKGVLWWALGGLAALGYVSHKYAHQDDS
jgi:uncharacterized protein YukE